MRKIGLLGGMSWESTAEYYRLLNEGVRDALGGLHSARIVLASVDFAEVERMQVEGRWEDAGALLAAEARGLESAGAEVVLLCTNTMHKVADDVASAVSIPLLHLADATADAVTTAGLSTVGLLGTAFTMEQDFYRGRLEDHGLTASSRTPLTAPSCTASSTTNSAWAAWRTPRGTPCSPWRDGWWSEVPRASSSAARNWSSSPLPAASARYRSSRPRACTWRPRSGSRSSSERYSVQGRPSTEEMVRTTPF